jgi:predicted glycosyltransferase
VIFVHNAVLGNMIELDQTYGCMFTFKESLEDQKKSIEKGVELLVAADINKQWWEKRERLLNDKIDVTQWMMDFVEQTV